MCATNSKAHPLRIETLQEEIDELKRSREKESRSFAGRIKLWGAVIGLIGGLFAIPRGLFDSYVLLFGEPKTTVVGGNDLKLEYTPNKSEIRLSFDALMTNEGDKNDVINNLLGQLSKRGDATASNLPFSDADFDCSSQNIRMSMPISLRKDVPLNFSCSTSSEVSGLSRGPFISAGYYQFQVEVVGQDRKEHDLDFCFYLTDEALTELFKSTGVAKKRFLYPNCIV
jgi:hypothetical protein